MIAVVHICDRSNFTTFQTVTTPRSSELLLPASFTDTLGLLLHRYDIKSYSMLPVSCGELPKRAPTSSMGVASTHTTHGSKSPILS